MYNTPLTPEHYVPPTNIKYDKPSKTQATNFSPTSSSFSRAMDAISVVNGLESTPIFRPTPDSIYLDWPTDSVSALSSLEMAPTFRQTPNSLDLTPTFRATLNSLGLTTNEFLGLYKFVLPRWKNERKLPYFELSPEFVVTYKTPQRVYLDSLEFVN